MDKIYMTAEGKNVAAFVVYGDTSDSKIYDGTGASKTQIAEADLVAAFKNGRVLVAIVGQSATDYLEVIKVSGNKASTVDLVSSTVTVTEWAAKAAE